MDAAKTLGELIVRVSCKRPPIETAKWTTRRLMKLGPTYIKLGQMASTRTEIFSPEVIAELQTLQEHVEPMSYKLARLVLEEEGLHHIDIEEAPLASASIGQVHKVKNEPWVVKIQRPGIRETIDKELNDLENVVKIGAPFMGEFAELLHEWGPMVRKETDYIREARNMKKCRKLYCANNPIVVPRVLSDHTTKRVLCMEYMQGHRLSNLPGFVNREGLAFRLLKMQIVQVVEGGLIHCDPHPGNIAIDNNGNIIYYDFGMMSWVGESNENLAALLNAVYRRDVDGIIQCLLDLDMIIMTDGKGPLNMRPYIRFLLGYMENGGNVQDVPDLQVLENERCFRLTTKWSFLFRSFFVIEGITKDLYPEQSLIQVIEPFARQLLNEDDMRDDMIAAIAQMPMALKSLQGSMNESLDASNTLRTRMHSLENEITIIRVIIIYRILHSLLQ